MAVRKNLNKTNADTAYKTKLCITQFATARCKPCATKLISCSKFILVSVEPSLF